MEKKSNNCLKKNQTNNSRAFVILCNNVQFFHHFCKWFPKDGFSEYDFYVVFDNRLNDIRKELELVRDSTDNETIKRIEVVNGDEIIDYYKNDFKYASKNRFCLNNLKDVYFLEKYDYVYSQDDDIVVFRYGNIWKTKQNVFWNSGNFSEKKMYIDFIENYIKKNPMLNPEKAKVVHVGQYFLNKSILETYKKSLSEVYNNEKLVDKLIQETRQIKPNGWYLDNLLIRMAISFYKQIPIKNTAFVSVLGNNYLIQNDCKLTKQTVMFHYSAPKKPEVYSKLEKSVLEKLFTPNEISVECSSLTTISRRYYESVKV